MGQNLYKLCDDEVITREHGTDTFMPAHLRTKSSLHL